MVSKLHRPDVAGIDFQGTVVWPRPFGLTRTSLGLAARWKKAVSAVAALALDFSLYHRERIHRRKDYRYCLGSKFVAGDRRR